MSDPLLEVENLSVQYTGGGKQLTAVSDVSFSIDGGEYFGLVGESGCGKSTLARTIIGTLEGNGEITEGTIRFKGNEIQNYSERELIEQLRWKEISWIPQGSMNSLDPLERVNDQAVELAQIHTDLSRKEALQEFGDLLDIVGISKDRGKDYPHQLSGGMQQRIIIAFSLLLESSLLIADEPTTALDVIMQDQVLQYIEDIRDSINISLLLITHDISLVFESCERMATMHAGQFAEVGSCKDIFQNPHHPYSILLKDAFPDHRYPDRELSVIQGHPPETLGKVDYCTFYERCPYAIEDCEHGAPPREQVGDEHFSACIRNEVVNQDFEPSTSRIGDAASEGERHQ